VIKVKNSIVLKLWLTIVAIFGLVLALLTILLQQFFDNYVMQQQTQELTRLATYVQALLLQSPSSGATSDAEQLAGYAELSTITYSLPYTQNAELKQAYQAFTVQQKQNFQSGQAVVVHGNRMGDEVVSVFLMIPSVNGPAGMVDVSQEMSVLDAPLRKMQNLTLFDIVLGVVLATGLAFVVSKNLSRPLIQMNESAEEMARGNFNRRVDVITGDEVGRLGNTFNTLASQLALTIEALSIERDQLSDILSSLEDGVVAADLEGNVTLANPPAIRKLRSMSITEQGVTEIARLPERMRTFFTHVLEFQELLVREVTWDGRFLVVTMIPQYESGGTQLRGVLAVIRDVTEERRLDRLRKDFIANVSHELRTPLSMMQGYAEALLDNLADDPVQRQELTEIIHDESLRMKRLVNDLLDFAQLESGQFQMRFSLINAPLLLKRVARKFSALSVERGIPLTLSIPSENLSIWADEDRMEQVFTNLLDNAFRHTKAGSVTLDADVNAHFIHIRVKDTGSGIPEEDIPFIFERFYKADKARTRSVGGTGLGLAITRHIVVEHGGDIIVKSTLGQGTVFTVVLPLQEEEG
jgi:two-component system, OmpR family, sensor histidine kinase ResE